MVFGYVEKLANLKKQIAAKPSGEKLADLVERLIDLKLDETSRNWHEWPVK